MFFEYNLFQIGPKNLIENAILSFPKFLDLYFITKHFITFARNQSVSVNYCNNKPILMTFSYIFFYVSYDIVLINHDRLTI